MTGNGCGAAPPVEETVTLREEKVAAERRNVDRELSPEEAEAAFEGGTVEATGTSEEAEGREVTRLAEEIIAARQAFLENQTLQRENGKPFAPEVLERTRSRGLASTEALAAMVHEDDPDGHAQQHRELRRQLVDVEQSVLLDARAGGTYSSHTLQRAQHFIDEESARMQ